MSASTDSAIGRWAGPLLGIALPLLAAWPVVSWFDHERAELNAVHVELSDSLAAFAAAEQVRSDSDQARWDLLNRSQVIEALDALRSEPLLELRALRASLPVLRIESLSLSGRDLQATVVLLGESNDAELRSNLQRAGFAELALTPAPAAETRAGQRRFELRAVWRGEESAP